MKINTIFVLLLAYCRIFAQFGSFGLNDPYSVSLAGSVTPIAFGVYALNSNPANLSLFNKYNLEIITPLPFPNLFIRAGLNFFNIKEYNHFFGGVLNEQGIYVARLLTNKDKKRFVKLFDDDAKIKANVSSNIFSFYYNFNNYLGAFGLSANEIVFASFFIPKTIANFINGNEINRIYDFSKADFKSSWYRVYSFSYSNEIFQFLNRKDFFLSFGFSIKYYNGYFILKNNNSSGYISFGDMAQIDINYKAELSSSFSPNLGLKHLFEDDTVKYKQDISPYLKPAGSGFGYDFGIYFKPLPFIGISAAIKDLGKIKWHQKTALYYSKGEAYFDGIQDLINENTRDDIIDSILNSLVQDTSHWSSSFYTNTPTNLKLGLCFDFSNSLINFDGILRLSFDLSKGFNDEYLNSRKPRYSFGFEFQLERHRPIIRIGYSYGGNDFNFWSAGLAYNYNFFEIAFGISDIQYLVQNLRYLNRVGFAFGTKFTL